MKTMIKALWTEPKMVRKFIVALLAAVAIAVTNGILPPGTEAWVDVAIAFVGSLGVYGIRNDGGEDV